MTKLSLGDLDLYAKRVLVRVDFNVPLRPKDTATQQNNTRYEVADDTRIRAALPTLRTIIEASGKAILLSHLGRPNGVPDSQYSLSPVAEHLSDVIGQRVRFSSDTIGPVVQKTIRSMPNSSLLLLENTRFFPGETQNDPAFAAALADLGDVFVNDAFGTSHRAHASNVGVATKMNQAAAGLLLEREIRHLGRALEAPERPMIALLGGAKVSDKIGVITNLIGIVDEIIIGGAMSYTFLKASGHSTGCSLVEDSLLNHAKAMLESAGGKLSLPKDHIISTSIDTASRSSIVSGSIPDGYMGLDIGPETVARYTRILRNARTIIWNGPMGVFEVDAFAAGTRAMATAVAEATKRGAMTIVGGGDSVAAITEAGLANSVRHISTGGGAMLEFLEGKALPGLATLTDKA